MSDSGDYDLFGTAGERPRSSTTSKLKEKMQLEISKLREEKAKAKDKLSSFAEVVQAVAAFDTRGRIKLAFDKDDTQYDISGLQQHGHQAEQAEATLREPQGVPVPAMNVCIMIVGTRGDVQPFLGIAQRLQQDGHRVRLATHAVYRDFVTEHGVEFYPLGGDPKELAAYMVKTGGHLIPLKYENLTQDVPRNIKMLEEILQSTWPAVTAADPHALGEGKPGRPFQAHAIISNPVTYGHIHVAERLGVPLHIMFPQPWVPTTAFPHPLSNMPYDNKRKNRNYMSYKLVDLLMWQGTESMVNEFRTEVLGLRKIRKGDGGRDMLLDLAIPHAFMWSPALVAKPADWGDIYDVIGTVLLKEAGSKYTPSPELEAFLGNDGGPIFVGFGSMVIEDPAATTKMIIEAAKLANNVRVLIQSSWSDMSGGLDVPDNIFFLGNCPHDWLMPRVSAVVHHGGAGTTAAGLLAGKPTFIVPFFGDQPFWGRAVVNAGVGHEPCPITELTVEKLHAAFVAMQSPEMQAKARALQQIMAAEDGVGQAVASFYRHLPLKVMRCDLCLQLATKWSDKDKLRLCDECEYVVTTAYKENSVDDIREYQCVDYGARGPDSTLEGVASGAGALLHELGSGVKDVFMKPAEGYREHGAAGAVIGLVKGVTSGLFIRPIQGVAVFADHVATGHHNKNRGSDERKLGSVWFDSKSGQDAHRATMRADEHDSHKKKHRSSDAPMAVLLSPEETHALAEGYKRLVSKAEGEDAAEKLFPTAEAKHVPPMNIVVLAAGTWSEHVAPLVAIARRLLADGHRVRVATHESYRHRVAAAGLEFYPLDGRASTLTKFLQHQYAHQKRGKKNFFGGSSRSSLGDFDEHEDLRALVYSLWPACVEVDPLAPGLQFRADFILAHPLVFGQTIVAERLGVPLHCVSTTPLSKTQAFAHPLHPQAAPLSLPYVNTLAHSESYDAVDKLLGDTLHGLLDDFRGSLGLLHTMSRRNLLHDWRIPHAYLYNAALLPKPSDWGEEICIAGYVEYEEPQPASDADTATAQRVQAFAAETASPLVYFGVERGDWDPARVHQLVQDLEHAAASASVRVLLQIVGQADVAALYRSGTVLELPSAANPPSQFSAVVVGAVHWGDLSVTSAWLRAGVPACVVARNATQRLWGHALARAGAGAEPIAIEVLSATLLASAFQQLRHAPWREQAQSLAKSFSSELAIETVVQHVYKQLPIQGMCCDVDPARLARIYDTEHQLKLSYEAQLAAQDADTASATKYLKYKPLKYSLKHPPRFSLRQLDGKDLRRAHFAHDVSTRPMGGLALTKKGVLSREQSVAVNVIPAPVTWASPEIMHARTQQIHAAYKKLLAERAVHA